MELEFDGVVTDPWGNTQAGFSAETEINRKEWGLDYNAVLEAGGVLIGEKVKLDAGDRGASRRLTATGDHGGRQTERPDQFGVLELVAVACRAAGTTRWLVYSSASASSPPSSSFGPNDGIGSTVGPVQHLAQRLGQLARWSPGWAP